MKELSDKDFERLNALADGELGGPEATRLRQRLQDEPQLQAAYDEIRQVKRKLGALAFDGAADAPPPATQPKRASWWPAAMAASFVAVAGLSALLVIASGDPDVAPAGVAAWHDHLSAQEYVVTRESGPLFVSLGTAGDVPVPDLSASKLFLVDTRVLGSETEPQRAVMHYRGLRGCRLTLWYGTTGAAPAAWPKPDADTAFRHWSAGDEHFALIANGMDRQRFAAIADYVEVLTRLDAERRSPARTAMAEAYERSERCA